MIPEGKLIFFIVHSTQQGPKYTHMHKQVLYTCINGEMSEGGGLPLTGAPSSWGFGALLKGTQEAKLTSLQLPVHTQYLSMQGLEPATLRFPSQVPMDNYCWLLCWMLNIYWLYSSFLRFHCCSASRFSPLCLYEQCDRGWPHTLSGDIRRMCRLLTPFKWRAETPPTRHTGVVMERNIFTSFPMRTKQTGFKASEQPFGCVQFFWLIRPQAEAEPELWREFIYQWEGYRCNVSHTNRFNKAHRRLRKISLY